MAEEKAEAPVQEEKKRSSGMMLLFGGLLAGAIIAGLAVYFLVGGSSSSDGEESDVQEEEVGTLAGNTSIKKLEDFNVNLRDPAGAKKLQMVISLEVKPTVAKLMEKPEIIDSIRDTIIMFTSEFMWRKRNFTSKCSILLTWKTCGKPLFSHHSENG